MDVMKQGRIDDGGDDGVQSCRIVDPDGDDQFAMLGHWGCVEKGVFHVSSSVCSK